MTYFIVWLSLTCVACGIVFGIPFIFYKLYERKHRIIPQGGHIVSLDEQDTLVKNEIIKLEKEIEEMDREILEMRDPEAANILYGERAVKNYTSDITKREYPSSIEAREIGYQTFGATMVTSMIPRVLYDG